MRNDVRLELGRGEPEEPVAGTVFRLLRQLLEPFLEDGNAPLVLFGVGLRGPDVRHDLIPKVRVDRVHGPCQRLAFVHRVRQVLWRALPLVCHVFIELGTGFCFDVVGHAQRAALGHLELGDGLRGHFELRRRLLALCQDLFPYGLQAVMAAMQQFLTRSAMVANVGSGVASDSRR